MSKRTGVQIKISLSDDVYEALSDMAWQEHREIGQQALVLIEQGLGLRDISLNYRFLQFPRKKLGAEKISPPARVSEALEDNNGWIGDGR